MLAGNLVEVKEPRARDAHLEPLVPSLAGRIGHVPGRVEDGHGAWFERSELAGCEGEWTGIAEDRARGEAACGTGEGAEGGAGREQRAGEHPGRWWLRMSGEP